MTLVATGLRILFVIHRPQPVFVSPMRLLHAGRCCAVAIVTGCAPEPLRVMNLQERLGGMTGKSPLTTHVRFGQGERFTNSQMARLAAIHQIH